MVDGTQVHVAVVGMKLVLGLAALKVPEAAVTGDSAVVTVVAAAVDGLVPVYSCIDSVVQD